MCLWQGIDTKYTLVFSESSNSLAFFLPKSIPFYVLPQKELGQTVSLLPIWSLYFCVSPVKWLVLQKHKSLHILPPLETFQHLLPNCRMMSKPLAGPRKALAFLHSYLLPLLGEKFTLQQSWNTCCHLPPSACLMLIVTSLEFSQNVPSHWNALSLPENQHTELYHNYPLVDCSVL